MSERLTHLLRQGEWRTLCGRDLNDIPLAESVSAISDRVNCEGCKSETVQAPASQLRHGASAAMLSLRFQKAPLEIYEDEIHDKAIYPGKGTGSSGALSYTLGGRINELGEYCEKFLPVVEDAWSNSGNTVEERCAEITRTEFAEILRMMIAVGKRAHKFKKALRRGETKTPPFRAFTPAEREGLDAEDGDTWWYQGAHTTERAGRRSWGRVILENIFKLMGRKRDGTIEGDGDAR